MTDRRNSLLDPAALIAAAGAVLLAVQWAVARPLWLDEEMIAINLRDRATRELAGQLWLQQSAPFGWLALQRAAVLTLGTSERALRLVPFLFGIATIATSVWIGRRWMTRVGAAVLVLLCALAQWLTFYFLELKPYSADAFFALLLPAVAAWSVEESRPTVFWAIAAIGQWFSNGALFVTPACAIVLVAMIARHDGWRPVLRASAMGTVLAGSFALNYVLVLRHASSYDLLHTYFAFALPPESAGLLDTLRWLGGQLAPFGVKPGSARAGLLLWLAAAAGFVVAAATGRRGALFFATVPPAAGLLAALRLVPIYERLTLWIVPALYVGVAFLADTTFSTVSKLLVASGFSRTTRALKPLLPAAAVAGLSVAAFICLDIVTTGVQDAVVRAGARHDNRGLDDREAVRWLLAQKRPGDIWMTTHFGAPAIWWYAGRAEQILEVAHQPGPGCRDGDLAEALADAPRVLLYLGFRFDDVPSGFDDLLVGRLSRLGPVSAYRPFARLSQALIVDRRANTGSPTTLSRLNPKDTHAVQAIGGCTTVRRAEISTFVQ